jgi:outer membrane protein
MKKRLNNMSYKVIQAAAALLFLLTGNLQAQELLTLEQAIAQALENNYDIRISRNDVRIEDANFSVGNAGMLPTLQAQVTDNNSISNSSQTRADGQVIELDDAKNNSLNYGVVLDWTIFDGFRMFARYDQLEQLKMLSEAELKLNILNKVSDVTATYYELVSQQQQLKALDTAIVISNQRVTLAQNRFTIGKASKLEVLNAQVDLNTDTSNLLRQKETYANTKALINELMARPAATDFRVIDEILVDEALLLPDLANQALSQNPQLQALIISRRVAELQLKQVRAGRYPTISVTTGYNLSDSQSSLGFTTQSSSRGWNYGFTARMNLFNGFFQNRNERIARIQIENTSLAIEQQNQALDTQLTTAYQTYLTNLELTRLEEKNEQIARQNLDITLDKFKIGTITTLEVRTAQLNYINAKTRYINARYQSKLSETYLKELAGALTF